MFFNTERTWKKVNDNKIETEILNIFNSFPLFLSFFLNFPIFLFNKTFELEKIMDENKTINYKKHVVEL